MKKTTYEFFIDQDEVGYYWVHTPTGTGSPDRFVTGHEALDAGWLAVYSREPDPGEEYVRPVSEPAQEPFDENATQEQDPPD